MSTSVLLPEAVIEEKRNMYSKYVRSTSHVNSSSKFARCDSRSSPSPCREKSRDNSPRPASSNVLNHRCIKCKDNQSSLASTFSNKLSFCDKNDMSQSPSGAVTSISAPELSDLMRKPTDVILLDSRSFISYNLCHIIGAINVGCADRVTKRRLQSGKISVLDLIKCANAKELFSIHGNAEIVIYDDDTTEIVEGPANNQSSLQTILKSLLCGERKVYFLKGGLVEFYARYESLCTQPKAQPSAPLYSPTTPITSNEIDTATASKILPFLYIGNERDVASKEKLKELGITNILNITPHIPFYFENDETLTYKRIQASDSGSQNLQQYFAEATEFIENVRKSGDTVIIHCQAGVSRSATITVAYMMQYCNCAMMEAFHFVKERRPIIAPNFNFMGQLMEFEKSLQNGQVTRYNAYSINATESKKD